MVADRSRIDFYQALLTSPAQGVEGTAQFERTGVLEILQLHPDFRFGDIAQPITFGERCVEDKTFDSFLGDEDIAKAYSIYYHCIPSGLGETASQSSKTENNVAIAPGAG